MHAFLSVSFVDPDGAGHEVMWVKPGVAAADMRKRADWTIAAPPLTPAAA